MRSSAIVTVPSGGATQAITPTRILDTRTSTGGHNGTFAASETYSMSVLGRGAVPMSGVAAVLANVTVIATTGSGYLTLWPTGQTRPTASNINFGLNTVVANQALIPLGTNGSISIFSLAAGVHVVLDISGWVGTTVTPAGGTVAVSPNRILDSRGTNGGRNGNPWHGGETATVPVLGTHGLPATGISAVYANVTIVPASSSGVITAFATGATLPTVDTVDVTAGVVVANFALIPVGPDGAIQVWCSNGTMHVVIDVLGLVEDGNPTAKMGVQPIQPYRAYDTRTTGTPLTQNQVRTVPVVGVGSVPATGVAAVVAHLVASNVTAGGGYFTAYPSGYPRPTASSLNFQPGMTVSNDVVIPVGADGAIAIYNSAVGSTHAILDIQGWIAEGDLTAVGPSVAPQTIYPSITDSNKAFRVLEATNRYAMTTWWNGPAQTLLAADLGLPSESNDDAVRRLSMQALGMSVGLAFNAYDVTMTQITRAEAYTRTAALIDRAASQHLVNHVGGWGESWQSPMWAGILGRAAWMMWDQLPSSTKILVARVVEHEADYGTRVRIHYLRNAAGTLITAGDSGSEDTSWWTLAAQVGTVMLPSHQHAQIWKTETTRYLLAAWSRPGDVGTSIVVNGLPLSSWLAGSNVEADGTVINHNRIASDYSTTTYQNLDWALLLAMAGQPAPQAVRQLLGPVYQAFSGVSFASPPYDAPGGSTYVPSTGQIYYPQGNEWGTGQVLPYALADGQALVFGYDPTATAATYLSLHLDAQLAMQARFGDGHTYLNDLEYNYKGREEHVAQLAAQLYWSLAVRDQGLVSFTNSPLG